MYFFFALTDPSGGVCNILFKYPNINHLLLSGLLITGGRSDDGDARTVEVWLPGDQSCLMPRLPDPGRRQHTQSSYTACGGQNDLLEIEYVIGNTCDTFDGEWDQSHFLSEEYPAVSWQSPAGILLMGGDISGTYSELLSTTTNTTTYSFSLRYETM